MDAWKERKMKGGGLVWMEEGGSEGRISWRMDGVSRWPPKEIRAETSETCQVAVSVPLQEWVARIKHSPFIYG